MGSSTKRISYIDVAKGIAIICIILGHTGIEPIVRVVYTFHVPIFYFITGYFFNPSKSVDDLVKNKCRTLVVPYFLTCLVIVILATVVGLFSGNAIESATKWIIASIYGAGETYEEPVFIQGIGAIWFLWACFWGSYFLRVSFKFGSKLRILFIAFLFLFSWYSKDCFWAPLSIQAGACATFFMYLGYLVKISKNALLSLPKEVKAFAVMCSCSVWGYFIYSFQSFELVHCDVGRGIIDIFGCVCASLIVILISRFIDKKAGYICKALNFAGRYSLLVLCVHIVELDLFPWSLFRYKLLDIQISSSISWTLVILCKLIMIFGAVWLLLKIKAVRRVFGYDIKENRG